MATAKNYPAWAITRALERGYDHPAHIRALYVDDVDAISLTHPYNWLTEEEVETIGTIEARKAEFAAAFPDKEKRGTWGDDS